MSGSLICGSMAFDTIMSFRDRFSDVILAEQLHTINVAFLVPELRKEFGGCAGNIAYNLRLLEEDPCIMATLGCDGAPYLERLKTLGISTQAIRVIDTAYTAQAFITTDANNNQITAFHPGAMAFANQNKVADVGTPIKLAIVAPDSHTAMMQHARDCVALHIPFIFDPGQGLPMFSGQELTEMIDLATYVVVNAYEAQMLMQRTNLSKQEIAARVTAFIITDGQHGSTIYTSTNQIDIPVVKASHVIDPTGCGDAFRAGLMVGIMQSMDWETTGRLASVMGAIKIAHQGGQNHVVSKKEIEEKFYTAFNYRF